MGAEFFHAGRRTDITEFIVPFISLAKAPKTTVPVTVLVKSVLETERAITIYEQNNNKHFYEFNHEHNFHSFVSCQNIYYIR